MQGHMFHNIRLASEPQVTRSTLGRSHARNALHPVMMGMFFMLVLALSNAFASGGTLNYVMENDSLAHTDRYYTHGGRLGWISDADAKRACGDGLMQSLPFIECHSDARWGFSLTQVIFTPRWLKRTNPDPADRPYAGWLHGAFGSIARKDAILDQLFFSVGVVGPASQAEKVQHFIHDIYAYPRAMGWGHQIGNELTLQAFYQRTHRIWRVESASGYGFDVSPHYGGALGNVYVYGNVGGLLRLGKNLPDDFGPPRVLPGGAGSDYSKGAGRFGWYAFAGVDGRAMARNLFLDGNTFRDSRSVQREYLVGDLQIGVVMDWRPLRLAYTHIWRTREFVGQFSSQAFGSLSLEYRY
jgi:lipid A 3-O-deacylase